MRHALLRAPYGSLGLGALNLRWSERHSRSEFWAGDVVWCRTERAVLNDGPSETLVGTAATDAAWLREGQQTRDDGSRRERAAGGKDGQGETRVLG